MLKSVLVVDDQGAGALREALSDAALTVVVCAPGEAVEKLKASPPDAIVVSGLGDSSARFVAHLRQGLPSCPEIVVSLTERNDKLRDQCLTGGAVDLSPEGQPEDIAARLDSHFNGWLRGAPRKPYRAPIRAQRTKQALTLSSADIDPTGFSYTGTTELSAGELVRVALPLPSGQMIVWGRVAELEGEQGVRFLALAGEERVRLIGALKALPEPTATPTSASASGVRSIPVMTRAPATSGLTPAKPLEAVAEATRPPAPSAPSPVLVIAPPSSPSPAEVTRPFVGSISLGSAAPVIAPPPPTTLPSIPPVAVPPAPPAPASLGIDELIGSSLADDEEPAPAPAPADQPPAEPAATWPRTKYTDEATTAALREALTLGLVSEVEGAPTGETVLSFVRTLSIPEHNVLAPEPPPGLPEQGIALRCLALRLRLFAYARDAAKALADGERVTIDRALAAALDAEVNTADAELQKATTAYLTSGDQTRIKDTNQFRNTIVRAQKDFRTAVARLKGEDAPESGLAMLLDEEARPVSSNTPQVRRDPSKEKDKDKPAEQKIDVGFFRRKDDLVAKRERTRIIIGAFVLAGLIGWMVVTYMGGMHPLGPEEVTELGAQSIIVDYDSHKGRVQVAEGWKLEPHRQRLLAIMASHKVDEWVVVTDKGMLVAFRKQGREVVATRLAAGALPKPAPSPPR